VSGHTPGPWIRDGRTVYALMPAGWRKGVEIFKNRFWVTVQKDPECSEEEAEANARLIAAAPELLDACLFALECTNGGDFTMNGPHGLRMVFIGDILKRAISKAKGKS